MKSRRKRLLRTAIDQVMAGFARLNGQLDVAYDRFAPSLGEQNPGFCVSLRDGG